MEDTSHSLHGADSIDYSSIHKNLRDRIQLDEEELDCFNAVLKPRKVPRKSLLLKQGQPCRFFNYVHAGALRAFTAHEQTKEATVMFALPDWWITDMYCFLNDRPAMMNIEAIEDSVVFQITKPDFESLFERIPKFERFFRLLMQNAYTREQLRVIERLTLPAEERYDSFLKKYPDAARLVTQKQMASYLGITPEFLSAIRKNKTKPIS